MDSIKIGKFIAMQRKQLSMTQQNLADKLAITNKAVSKWETGEGYPDISVLPALAEILNVTVDELLNGEKSNSNIKVDNPYCIKENTQQANYILDSSIRHFGNNYLISLAIVLLGIIASILGLKLYEGYDYISLPYGIIVYESLFYSIFISIAFLIIGIMFYNNICKGLKGDIQKYNSMIDEPKADFYKIIHKKHIFFYAAYLIQITILICVIPLYPHRCIGYYSAFKKIYGLDSPGYRYLIDYGFCCVLTLIVYFVLLCIGILIILKKTKKPKIVKL